MARTRFTTHGVLRSDQPGTTIARMGTENETAPASGYGDRKDQRHAARGPGALTWYDGTTVNQSPVEICDISDNGVQMFAAVPIAVGVSVYLTGGKYRCLGTVRHCKRDGGGFLIGLQFSRGPHRRSAFEALADRT